jgi:uncharacterized protein (TIGR00251 family)
VSKLDAHLRGDAVRFSVRLQPRASATEVVGVQEGSLKIRVTAPPVDGMANDALIDFLSRSLGTAKRNVRIVSGLSSRKKLVEVLGVNLESVKQLAG